MLYKKLYRIYVRVYIPSVFNYHSSKFPTLLNQPNITTSNSKSNPYCIVVIRGWLKCGHWYDELRREQCESCESKGIFEQCDRKKYDVQRFYVEKRRDGPDITKCPECRDIPEPAPPKSWDEKMEAMRKIDKRRY